MTPEELLLAVQFGDYEQVEAGLQQGLDPNYKEDEHSHDLIGWATQEGYADIIKLLARFGAEIDGGPPHTVTALYNAAGWGNLEVVEALIECGADVNKDNGGTVGTALFNAAAWGQREVVEILIGHSANVNAFNCQGRAALSSACSPKNADIAQLLLTYGAKKRVIDDSLPDAVNLASALLNHYDEVGYAGLGETGKIGVCVLMLKDHVERFGFDSVGEALSKEIKSDVVGALRCIGAILSAELTHRALTISQTSALQRKLASKVRKFGQQETAEDELDNLTISFYDDANSEELQRSLNQFLLGNRAWLPRF